MFVLTDWRIWLLRVGCRFVFCVYMFVGFVCGFIVGLSVVAIGW